MGTLMSMAAPVVGAVTGGGAAGGAGGLLGTASTLLNSGSGILSAIMGNKTNAEVQGYNNAALQNNINNANNQAFMQNHLAQQFLDQVRAPQTDSRGSTVRYIPGRGYVTELSDEARVLQESSDREQLMRNTRDADRQRREDETNYGRRLEQGRAADSFLEQLLAPNPQTRESVQDQLYGNAVRQTNQAFDDTAGSVATQALRSGASNAGNILESINQQRSGAVRDAGQNAIVQGSQLFDQMLNNRSNRLGSLQNTLNAQASAVPNAQFTPTNINDNLLNVGRTQQNLAPQAAPTIISAGSQQGAQIPFLNPETFYSQSNLFGGIMQNLSGLLDVFDSKGQNNQFGSRQLSNASY